MAINFTSRNRIEKLNKLADGGEASIYEYDSKTVIKLFKTKVDIAKKEEKVKYFISIKGQLPKNVIGPEDVVTVKSQFVGYSMRKIIDSEDLHMLTKPKYLTAAHLSNQDVLQIITDIGVNLNKLHSMDILIGDISDYNFQMNGKCDYFIDIDSWGVKGKYSPDAYTELFTCPDSYRSNGSVEFSGENERYNFAVLAFNMLTRIHPFDGTYLPNKKLSTLERMKQKISVVGKHKADIKIPKAIGSWKWMSPQLEKDFVEIFENGKKIDITPNLQELLKNMKYCSTHDIYYYSKFNECPLCNDNAKVKTAPVIAKVTQTANGPQITIVFTGNDCAYILSNVHYLSKDNKAVHFETGRKFDVAKGKRIDFSRDGKIVYVIDDNTIQIYDDKDQITATIDRMHKSSYFVKDRDLYYIDKGSNLVRLIVTQNGNMPKYLGQVYNALFGASDDGKVCVVSRYPQKAIITTHECTFEVDYTGKINEYAIKYDKVSKRWLFVYQLPNGKVRTMIFDGKEIKYDEDSIIFNAQPLGNIDFYNNTIWDPGDGKIIGTNLSKKIAKEFPCNVVDESSNIRYTGKGFVIYNKDKIYNYG